jgi:ATP-dependent DNA helicase DinG
MPTDEQIRSTMKVVFPFGEYREYQENAIFRIVKAYFDNTKYVILEAPTGAGKSAIAYTVAKTIRSLSDIKKSEKGPYALAAVKTRNLQKQYMESFDDMPLIWSGANYECALEPEDPDYYWGAGTCAKKRCPAYKSCEYIINLIEFMSAPVAITNYAYYMNATHIQSHISIIDECHNLEESLCSWMTVEVSTKFLDRYLTQMMAESLISPNEVDLIKRVANQIIDIDDEKNGWLDTMREVAKALQTAILELHRGLEGRIETIMDDVEDVRRLPMTERQKLTQYSRMSKYFKNFAQKLLLLANLKTDWVIASCVDESTQAGKKSYPKVAIKPLSVAEVSQARFFNRSQFFLMMSASVCDHELMMKYLGIPSDSCEYIQLPSTFPAENRPVVAINDIGKFSWAKREYQLPEFTNYLDLIIDAQFEGVRGIVHSASYDNAKYIEENSRHVQRMRFPTSDDLTEVVDMLKEKEDTIVVSPSVVEGLDLKGDLCRFSIFYKVPWSSLGDKWVKTRSEDNNWYCRDAVIKIIQGSGRGTRSKEDHSITIVMDGHFLRLYYRNQHFFPQWFLDAVQVVSITK